MNPTSDSTLPPPRITTRDAFLVFGLSEHYEAGANAGIPSQWNRFAPHLGHIAHVVDEAVTYGVVSNVDAANTFDYLCGVEVREYPPEPAAFTRLRIPAATYAVFEHRGHISMLQATFRLVWAHGLAHAGVKPADAPPVRTLRRALRSADGAGWAGIVGAHPDVIARAPQRPAERAGRRMRL